METKHSKPKSSKIFSFLPKSATVTFQNPPYSPGRSGGGGGGGDHHHHYHSHKLKGFSGPMIPDEARRKPINGGENSFETQEPTSPKISCMGQIKHKKKKVCESKNGLPGKEEIKMPKSSKPKNKLLRPSLSFGNLFKGKGEKQRRRRTEEDVSSTNGIPAPAPSLDQMKRFTSGRASFENFDWKAVHDRRVSADNQRDYYSDHDGSDDDDHEEVIIPHSAPMMIGGGMGIALEPRKEINLWKRRTMAPPRPLQIKT